MERLVEIAKRLRDVRRRHEQLGLSQEEAAFYDALAGGVEDVKADRRSRRSPTSSLTAWCRPHRRLGGPLGDRSQDPRQDQAAASQAQVPSAATGGWWGRRSWRRLCGPARPRPGERALPQLAGRGGRRQSVRVTRRSGTTPHCCAAIRVDRRTSAEIGTSANAVGLPATPEIPGDPAEQLNRFTRERSLVRAQPCPLGFAGISYRRARSRLSPDCLRGPEHGPGARRTWHRGEPTAPRLSALALAS